jgi:sec-independent protein translocase protein TatA
MMIHPLALGMPGPFELCILALLGLLLFGKRLPEIGRSVGKTIVEFKKGMNEVHEEIHTSSAPSQAAPPPSVSAPPQITASSGPQPYKFDPYTGKPVSSEANEKV